jgi:hypothetical protein
MCSRFVIPREKAVPKLQFIDIQNFGTISILGSVRLRTTSVLLAHSNLAGAAGPFQNDNFPIEMKGP